MPDPSHRPYQPMTIIRPDSLPRFWWLYPWSMARQLHRNCNALRALCDRLDDVNHRQADIIVEQAEQIENLNIRLRTIHKVNKLAGNEGGQP